MLEVEEKQVLELIEKVEKGMKSHEEICKLFDEAIRMIPRWIPVTERLPEQYKTVIVWTSLREMGEAEYDGKHFVWMDDDGINDYAKVTHWMPLPAPPQEE